MDFDLLHQFAKGEVRAFDSLFKENRACLVRARVSSKQAPSLPPGLGVDSWDDIARRLDDEIDKRLVVAYSKGDVQAFNDLYERHKTLLVKSLAVRLSKFSNEIANDIAATTWEEVIENFAAIAGKVANDGYRFGALLHRYGTNNLIEYTRKKSTHELSWEATVESNNDNGANDLDDESYDTVSDNMRTINIMQTVHATMDVLTEKEREAVCLQYFSGLTYEEIGDVQGCKRETIKERLERAKEKLRERLSQIDVKELL